MLRMMPLSHELQINVHSNNTFHLFSVMKGVSIMSEPFDEIRQVEMSIKAAQKSVGDATMNMNPKQLENATNALNEAKKQLNLAKQYEMSDEFMNYSSNLLKKLEHQLNEAKK